MTPDKFKAIRLRADLSLAGLAKVLRLSDGARYIRMIEKGERTPSGPITLLMELLDQGRL